MAIFLRKKTCSVCGKEFSQFKGRQKDKEWFCSKECYRTVTD